MRHYLTPERRRVLAITATFFGVGSLGVITVAVSRNTSLAVSVRDSLSVTTASLPPAPSSSLAPTYPTSTPSPSSSPTYTPTATPSTPSTEPATPVPTPTATLLPSASATPYPPSSTPTPITPHPSSPPSALPSPNPVATPVSTATPEPTSLPFKPSSMPDGVATPQPPPSPAISPAKIGLASTIQSSLLARLASTVPEKGADAATVLFEGELSPNGNGVLTLHSHLITLPIHANAAGVWQVVAGPFEIGRHLMTITTIDPATGRTVVVSRAFFIQATQAANSLAAGSGRQPSPILPSYLITMLILLGMTLAGAPVVYLLGEGEKTPDRFLSELYQHDA